MTYETFLSVIEKTSRVKIRDVIGILDKIYRSASESDDAIDEYYKLYDLIEMIFHHDTFIADNNDYHNIAVVCARYDDYDVSCRFIQKGLQIYPYNIDLLADCLKYGLRCGLFDLCNEAYKKLVAKKRNWNWRAYRFAIDYLMDLSDIDLINRDEEIRGLINDFQSNLPEEEDSYLVEAEYIKNLTDKQTKDKKTTRSFLSILEFATSEKSPIQKTPRCDLKLADFYYDNGTNIKKAIELLDRCKKNSIEIQSSVNRNYVYLLSSLCKMTLYYDIYETLDLEQKEELVKNVYRDYHIAALNASDSRVRDCKKLIESFVRETEIPYPYDDAIESTIY